MDRKQILSRAYSPRTSADPTFVRDSVGVALFGQAQEQVAARGRDMLPVSAMPPPSTPSPMAPMPPPRAIPSPLTIPASEIERSLPDTGPTIDDFTRHGTLPGFGDAAQDPYGSALRRRLTVLLRSS